MFKFLVLFVLITYSQSTEQKDNKWEQCIAKLDNQLVKDEQNLKRLAKNEQDELAIKEINERDDKADTQIDIINSITNILGGLGGTVGGILGGIGVGGAQPEGGAARCGFVGGLLAQVVDLLVKLLSQVRDFLKCLPIKKGSNSEKVLANMFKEFAEAYVPFYKVNEKFLNVLNAYYQLNNLHINN